MSNEIRTVWETGQTLYGCIFQPDDGTVWYPAGEVWETWGAGSRTAADYIAMTLSESGGSGYYTGDFPTDITTEDSYDVMLRKRAGATPADSDQRVGVVLFKWSGAAAVAAEDEVVPTTVTSLCNYALAKIGGASETQGSFRIATVYDGSDLANLCLDLQPVIRKEVLARADWSEALKFADLGAASSGVAKADWEYAFTLPTDYLARCKQVDESYLRSTKSRYRFEYDKKIMGGYLLTNNYSNADGDSAYIRYVWNLTDPTKFSSGLNEAIAVKLAAALSAPLLGDKGYRRSALLGEYENLVLPVAIGQMATQDGDEEDEGEYSAITCRTN